MGMGRPVLTTRIPTVHGILIMANCTRDRKLVWINFMNRWEPMGWPQ
jgi:hypothetical protein